MIEHNAYEVIFGFLLMNALVVALVYALFGKFIRAGNPLAKPAADMINRRVKYNPFNILKDRLARGEIRRDEFDKLWDTLRHA